MPLVSNHKRVSTSSVAAVVCLLLPLLSPTLLSSSRHVAPQPDQDLIIFTAHQNFNSRVYLLRMDGSIYDYFEYENFRLVGLEIVNDDVYVAEAFAPRVEKLDLLTGDLEVIVDDWSLYYFYDVAFDGSYFYVDEWDLNRYDINGDKDGVASFDENVLGCAWDGAYLWTLDDENIIKCWDLSGWPTVTHIAENNFASPSPFCRGLFFDGEYFWTAESIESVLGQIYRFDYSGEVIDQWTAPAFQGWGACLLRTNRPPNAPEIIYPPHAAQDIAVDVQLEWSGSDPKDDSLLYSVYLDATHPPQLVSQYQFDTFYAPSLPLPSQTRYYWQVCAHDEHGDSTFGPVWSFTTASDVLCGDIDNDGDGPNVADLSYLVDFLFRSGPPPAALQAVNVDGFVGPGGPVDVADLSYLVEYLFKGGPEPVC